MDETATPKVPPRRRRSRRTSSATTDSTPPTPVTSPPSSLGTLGQRLREVRKRRGWSQTTLAAPEFTKSYVSALERGKARPSLKALELLARRLEVPLTDLLQIASAEAGVPDPAALDAPLRDQLDQAAVLLSTQHPAEARRLLDSVAAEFAAFLPDLPTDTRVRLHLLRGTAALRRNDPAAAHQEFALAQPLAEEIDPEAAERVRNARGEAFFAQNAPQRALELHAQCLTAVTGGVVQDLNLRLAIYRNLAADYAALNRVDQAISTYQEALRLVEPSNALEQQAANYWALSRRQKDAGHLARATGYAVQANTLYEAAQNQGAAAQARVKLAAILIERGDHMEAERLLQQAQRLLPSSGNDQIASQVATQFAALELRRDRLAQAEAYAQKSVVRAQRATQQAAAADVLARTESLRAYARALCLAGQVDERAGRAAQADGHFQQAITLLTEADLPHQVSEVEHGYAELLMERGAHEPASLHYRAALRARQPRGSW